MKGNIHDAIAEKGEVELPIGVFAPDEAQPAPMPAHLPDELRARR